MYPKFIEIHKNGVNMLMNIDHIVGVVGSNLISTTKEVIACDEHYDEISDLITNTGSLIHKADPRLDTTKPLTFDEMRGMIGQPVWNSNTDLWGLVSDPMYADMVTVRFADETLSNYKAEDLIRFPYYRMRQESTMDFLKRKSGEHKK